MSDNEPKLDALYTIFEKHLYNFENENDSEEALIANIVEDYLEFLVANKIAVPQRWCAQIADELKEQVRKMLLKKIYGCFSLDDYRKNAGATAKKKRRKLVKLF